MIDVARRRAEVTSRRAEVRRLVGAGSVLLMFATVPRVYTGDVDYEYRQENNFYYLTNLRQENAALVMLPEGAGWREVLFLPRRNPFAETWTGHMYSADEAQQRSGIDLILAREELDPFMRALAEGKPYQPGTSGLLLAVGRSDTRVLPSNFLSEARTRGAARLLMLAPFVEGKPELTIKRREESREWTQESRFANRWESEVKNMPVAPAWNIFADLRLRKSAMEQQLLQHAVDISTEGLARAMRTANTVTREHEAEAEVEYVFRRHDSDPGYPSIVGCGPNATTLHAWESKGEVRAGDLLLMDTGAEYDHYTADVTRTFPVSGRFSPAQSEIYDLVYAAQEAAFKRIRHGATFADMNDAARRTIGEGLLRLGLITDTNTDQSRIWFMHGTSHWLGMNVHDVGAQNAKFAPGMVFTVEPGIYIRPDALDNLPDTEANRKFIQAVRPAFERYKGIGVRIEDDILITAAGWRNMSERLPRARMDVEAFIARLRGTPLADAATSRTLTR